MRELSRVEVEEVGGGFVNFAIGGAIGGFGYLAINGITGQSITAAGLAGSIVGGAVTSGFSAFGQGLRGVASVANTAHSAGLGTLSGAATAGAVGSASAALPREDS